MKYARAGDAYSFECCMFKVSIIGDIEKIEFNDAGICKANIDGAFSELKRLKEIRAENEKSEGKKVASEMVVNVSVNAEVNAEDVDMAIKRIKESMIHEGGIPERPFMKSQVK